jgi:hypothetical protein
MSNGTNSPKTPASTNRLSRALASGPLSFNRRSPTLNTAVQDTDAMHIQNSLRENRRSNTSMLTAERPRSYGMDASLTSPPGPPSRASTTPALFDSADPRFAEKSFSPAHIRSTPSPASQLGRHSPFAFEQESQSFLSDVTSVRPTEKPKIVMTPKQFEDYRRRQEEDDRKAIQAKAAQHDSDEEVSDDEDEKKRNREANNNRRKQEAHLTSYRQSMMKITGEQGSISAIGQMRMSNNTSPAISISPPPRPGSSTGVSPLLAPVQDEDDEDVPLGLLMSQPGHQKSARRVSSIPNLGRRSQTFPAPAASVAGDSKRHSQLPPFARNLPMDVPVGSGASIRPSVYRSSYSQSPSVYGGPLPASRVAPAIPGGLVGVIADEERARAARRASSQTGIPPRPATAGTGLLGMSGTRQGGYAAVPQGYNDFNQPTNQATEQLNASLQQMNLMMQNMMMAMQAQGMHGIDPAVMQGQMQQLQQMQQANGLLSPAQVDARRPQSMMSTRPSPLDVNMNRHNALNMLDQNMNRPLYAGSVYGQSIHGGNGYAPSIAPSERSTVGLPSRYRPVSSAVADPTPPMPLKHQASKTWRSSTAQNNKNSGDEDEEAGWAELKRRKEMKKASWRMKNSRASAIFSS